MKIADLTPKAKADLIMQKILRGKEVAEAMNTAFEQRYTISGKSADYWRKYFDIKVPKDNMTPQLAIETNMKLVDLYQEASFHYKVAMARKDHLRKGTDSAYYARFGEIIEEFKAKDRKIPAAATLEALAKLDTEDLEHASEMYKIEYNFWKQTLEQITRVQKMVENAAISAAVEMNHSKSLDRMQYGNGYERE